MKGKKPKFDEVAVNKIVDMYDGGKKSVLHIAKEMKTTATTVRSYLKKKGVYNAKIYKSALSAKASNKDASIADVLRLLGKAEDEVKRLKALLRNMVDARVGK